jgi:hypothetical protein
MTTYNVRRVALHMENIPAELRELRQWVAWKEVPARSTEKKSRKVPIDPHTGAYAQTDNPSTWGSCDEAIARMRADELPGIGFVFVEGGNLCGVDLDWCRDPDTGAIGLRAKAIIDQLATYSEASVSGTGVHSIARGTLPDGARARDNVEMYSAGRYFCVTGAVLPGSRTTVEERTAQLARVHATYLGIKATSAAPRKPHTWSKSAGHADHAQLLKLAERYVAKAAGVAEGARNNTAFRLAGHVASFIDERGEGPTEAEILKALRSWNARCDPPLDEVELCACVASALRNGTPREPKRLTPPGSTPRGRTRATP